LFAQTPPPGAIGSESSWKTGGSSNAPPARTQQQQHRQPLVHRNAAIGASENMIQDTHSNMVHRTG
jgi:hypothetical protein